MLLKDLLSSTKDKIKIKGISSDFEQTNRGDVFIDLKGNKKNCKKALKNGAVALIGEKDHKLKVPFVKVENARQALSLMWSKYYSNPQDKLILCGITGTNGKTTSTYILNKILKEENIESSLIGTIENMIPNATEKAHYTTPPPESLYKLLNSCVENKVTHCVMEVSSHALSQERVYGLKFKVAAFTNLTKDHLDYHKTMEEYLKAKLKLFDMCEIGVVNIDDKYKNKFLQKCRCVTYSYENENADFYAKEIMPLDEGTYFKIKAPDGEYETMVNTIGKFSVYNALCAAACAYCLGIPTQKSAEVIKTIKGVKGRMERVPDTKDFTVIIDYAHTPDGLLNVLKALNEVKKKRLICVFGCGGDRDKEKRPLMGEIASKNSDFCVVTTDNPRTENERAIINDILVGMKDTKTGYIIIEDRKCAIEFALSMAKKDDIILIAGKGHEDYQIFNDKVIHFDEREIIKNKLKGRE